MPTASPCTAITPFPAYPASHGCVRVTEAAMDWLWAENLMARGSVVWVH